MLSNFLKLTWRNLAKHKTHSSITICGFAVGIAACLLISLFIRDELSYDRHTPDGERIYRFYVEYHYQGNVYWSTSFPSPFAQTILNEYPEIEKVGRLFPVPLFGAGDRYFRRVDQNQNFFEEGFVWADQGLIDTLQIPIVQGDPRKALSDPRSIVISKKIADKYFPSEDPVGKLLVVNNNAEQPYRIGGVMADFPRNSHLQYNFFMSLARAPFGQRETTRWTQSNHNTYALLKEGVDSVALQEKLKNVIRNHYKPAFEAEGSVVAKDIEEMVFVKMLPLRDIHLKSVGILEPGGQTRGDIRFVWLFGMAAVGIFLIACVNFINLSTAKSANRAKEVGLRKVVGSNRALLIQQFLGESLIISAFSFALAVVMAELFLPVFNHLLNKDLSLPWMTWQFPLLLLVAILVVGFLAGLFPAFYLSSFKPISVLRGSLSMGSRSGSIRSVLVVFQFSACILLIIGTIFVYRQQQYILSRPLGYDREQVVMIEGTNVLGQQIQSFKQELKKLSGVESVSISDYVPIAGGTRNGNGFWKEGRSTLDPTVNGQRWIIDEDYIQTMGMRLVEGRNFSVELQSDRQAAIINRRMAEKLGLSNPVGSRITNGFAVSEVIGVVEDFNFDSLTSEIFPLCMNFGYASRIVNLRLVAGQHQQTLDSIQSVWAQFVPNQEFRYNFLDESYAAMYENVRRMLSILTWFSVLAIVIACLGLFALSAFMTEQRSKEISVRRVIGASFASILQMLSLSFLRLVFISFMIAVPFSWYLLENWLNTYEYRINLRWDVFIYAGMIACGVAILTVSYHAFRAAHRNPVHGLRSE